MSKRTQLSCDDCYFRQSGLCALRVDAPCPTFRLASSGSLTPPGQAPLITRQLETRVVAQHQAA
jgi:hypothetical protein